MGKAAEGQADPTVKSVEQILDRYLARTSELAEAATAKRLEREQDRN